MAVPYTFADQSAAQGISLQLLDDDFSYLDGLVTNATSNVDSIAALRAIAPTENISVNVLGYYEPGDNGGGLFYGATPAAAGTYVEDSGVIILPDGGDGSTAWIRQISQPSINVRWFGAKGDGATEDTAAFNAAIAYAYNNFIGIVGVGFFKVSDLTYPTTRTRVRLQIIGGLVLTEGATFTVHGELVGGGGVETNTESFAFNSPDSVQIFPSATSDPVISFEPAGQHLLENVYITGMSGVGIYLFGSQVNLRNVSTYSADSANSIGLVIDSSFWVNVSDSSFISHGAAPQAVQIITNSGDPALYSGIITFNNVITKGKAYLLKGRDAAVVNIEWNDCSWEVIPDGEGAITLDCTTIPPMLLNINRPTVADTNLNTTQLLRVIGTNPTGAQPFNVAVDDVPDYPIFDINNSTYPIRNLVITPLVENQDGSQSLPPVPVTPYPVPQTPADWAAYGPGVITTVVGPDGNLSAGEYVTGGGSVLFFSGATPTDIPLNVGDWIVVGCNTAYDASIRLTVFYGGGETGQVYFNGVGGSASSNILIPGYEWSQPPKDNAYHFLISAYKVTKNTLTQPYDIWFSGQSNTTGRFDSPCLMRIPSGTISDGQVLSLARTLRPWASSAQQGELAGLNLAGLHIGNIRLKGRLFADLPSPTAANAGTIWYVTDLSGVYTPNAVVTGGGARKGYVRSDGTNIIDAF